MWSLSMWHLSQSGTPRLQSTPWLCSTPCTLQTHCVWAGAGAQVTTLTALLPVQYGTYSAAERGTLILSKHECSHTHKLVRSIGRSTPIQRAAPLSMVLVHWGSATARSLHRLTRHVVCRTLPLFESHKRPAVHATGPHHLRAGLWEHAAWPCDCHNRPQSRRYSRAAAA